MSITRQLKNKKNKNKTQKKKVGGKVGGKVIGYGGFGCAFRPALKCKGDEKREEGRVSKLMRKRYAEDEHREITRFLHQLKKVPNYKNYYIVDGATVCEPDNLTKEDLENFASMCKPMRKMEITENNVNSRLGELRVLNLPDGGMDVGDYIEKQGINNETKKNLKKMLVELLIHGVVPMNKLEIYHGDIKESNVLVGKDGFARLIDWGLSAKTNGLKIPKLFSKKPFQYNIPFSVVLFNTTFADMFGEFGDEVVNKKGELLEQDVKQFLRGYINKWNQERGEGHFELIKKLIKSVTGKNPMTLIVDYLAQIIMEYSPTGKDDWLMKYFKDIYLKNIDVWGTVMCYSPILEKTKDPHLKRVFAKFLYNPANACKVINLHNLVNSL
jgi:serine/threonine protein kinase